MLWCTPPITLGSAPIQSLRLLLEGHDFLPHIDGQVNGQWVELDGAGITPAVAAGNYYYYCGFVQYKGGWHWLGDLEGRAVIRFRAEGACPKAAIYYINADRAGHILMNWEPCEKSG